MRRPQWPTEALTKITPFGIMNVNGVPKPVYRALQMLRDFTADAAPRSCRFRFEGRGGPPHLPRWATWTWWWPSTRRAAQPRPC